MAEQNSQLLSIALLDQRDRWTKGDKPPVEDYLREVPELSSDREGLLDFIYQEVLLREESGEVPRVEDFLQRFPELSHDLQLQFEVHQHLPRAPKPIRQSRSEELPSIDGFVISEVIGQGGFGTVYRAWDVSLKRTVALKILSERNEPGRKHRSRFAEEAQAAARLSHPNIVQIHSVSTDPQLAYFCLEHVDGGTLAQFMQGRPQPVREAAQFVATLARVVHYAHLCHVIHCDVKPANILLQRRSGDTDSSADQRPGVAAASLPSLANLPDFDAKVTDFGLARRMDGESGLATIGLAGTLPYMAPEQLTGTDAQASPAVDIYALGAILYEMLTGRPPFLNDSLLRLYLSVRKGTPPAPRELRPNLSEDLNAICLKCLEAEPARRYSSAQALADDLNLFLQEREVSVRPLNWPQRIDRWRRRNPLPAGLLALLISVIAISFVAVTLKMLQAERAEQAERKRADELDAALYLNQFLLAEAAHRNHDAGRAARILEDTNPLRRSFEWGYLREAVAGRREVWPVQFSSSVTRLVASPDGRVIAATEVDRTTLIDAATGQPSHVLSGFDVELSAPAFSPDGKLLATSGRKGTESYVQVWDVASGAERKKIGPLLGGIALTFIDEGRRLLTLSIPIYDNKALPTPAIIEVWDVASGTQLSSIAGPDTGEKFTPLGTLSPDGRWYTWTCSVATPASERGEQFVTVGDAQAGTVLHRLQGHESRVNGMVFSPDGESLATFGDDGQLVIWNIASGSVIHRFQGHHDAIRHAGFSSDGRQIVTSSSDRTVRIWDVATGQIIQTLEGLTALAWAASFTQSNRAVVASSGPGELSTWPLTARNFHSWSCGGAVQRLAVSQDGRFVIVLLLGGRLQIHDRQSGVTRPIFDQPCMEFALDPAGTPLATVDERGHLWRIDIGKLIGEPRRLDGIPALNASAAECLAWRPDGKQLAAVQADQTSIICLDLDTLQVRRTIKTTHTSVMGLAFHSDGRLLATIGTDDPRIFLWDAATGNLARSIDTGAPVRGIAFRPSSHELAAIPIQGRQVEVWNTSTGSRRLHFEGHKFGTNCITITPDGKRLITGSGDRTVKIWDAETGTELLTLDDIAQDVRRVSMSTNINTLAAASSSGLFQSNIFVWEAASYSQEHGK